MTICRPYSKPKKDAFTLIELLVVIGIVGVLGVLVIPAFTGIGRGQNMRMSVSQLRTTLALARQWAITHNDKTYVIFPDEDMTYNPPSGANMALRSYAVWTEKDGYVSEWRYLPPGVLFDPTDSDSGNLWNTTNDRLFNVVFPTNGSPTQQMFAISFTPNGRLNQKGASTIKVFLREGWVDANTNSGTASAPTLKPNSTYRVYLECRPLTGGVRVRE
ncbi:MAG: GspH/FimT family pseudopilin [Kiritimatiellae bacterium]|nr:GspH/FimT family pseudopilin [Kiritimatiellia bacterium]